MIASPRICLVSCPTVTEFEAAHIESEAIRAISEQAPIGILSLAAVLEQHGITPRIFDLNRLYYKYRDLEPGADSSSFITAQIVSGGFDIVGFSTMCSTYPLTIRIARAVKEALPGATILLGGPQASVVDVATLEAFPFIDMVVRGEAEETLPAVLPALAGGPGMDAIGGITFRSGTGKIVRNPNAPVILDLDQLPFPAFHLCPELKSCRTFPLELGRGCPFACTFCSTNDFFRRRFRLKSPRVMIQQMLLLREQYGAQHFELIHDMFTVDRRRVVEFCEALLASGHQFLWNCSARTDCVDDELIALMASAGCRGIFFGIETGSQVLQKIIDKRLDLREAAAMIQAADARRVSTTVSLITGFPEERREDLEATVDFFVNSARLDHAIPQLHILAPLAETPIHAQYRDQLSLDEFISDISFHGWRQDPADRELIARYRDIFPNFYAPPTPQLDRRFLVEFRDFVMYGLMRFRWILIAMHQCGGLLRVFERWRTRQRTAKYYAGGRFRPDFFEFVRSCYLPPGDQVHPLSVLLEVEAILEEAADQMDAPPVDAGGGRDGSAPRLSTGVKVRKLATSYGAIIEGLRAGLPLADLPPHPSVVATRPTEDGRIEIVQLTPLSADLLMLCDGVRSTEEIATGLSKSPDFAGMCPRQVCLAAFDILREQRLVRRAGVGIPCADQETVHAESKRKFHR